MDVELQADNGARIESSQRGPGVRLLRRKRRFDPASTWIDLFGEWQAEEVRAAQRYPECGGLTPEQLEEIYQETVIALLDRHYDSEDHARRALRNGIKKRALNFYRDERRRQELLDTAMSLDPPNARGEDSTESAVLIREDRLVVAEFLTELTSIEQKVFWLQAEGMKYRSIAKALGVEINTARNATRSCERKREHFQLLYDTGRLCGYRARIIHALQSGKATSEDLAQRAFAHLESCARCRAEHQTNAQRLRRTFQGQAAVLLPVPAFLQHLGWLARLDVRLKTIQHRLAPSGLVFTPGGVRERAVALLASGSGAAKATAGIVSVAVVASGTIGAKHVLEHKPVRHHNPGHIPSIPQQRAISMRLAIAPVMISHSPPRRSTSSPSEHHGRSRPRRRVSSTSIGTASHPEARQEPGGFAYLGVPTIPTSSHPVASTQPAPHDSGGPFSP